jgi:hypothetical protein
MGSRLINIFLCMASDDTVWYNVMIFYLEFNMPYSFQKQVSTVHNIKKCYYSSFFCFYADKDKNVVF